MHLCITKLLNTKRLAKLRESLNPQLLHTMPRAMTLIMRSHTDMARSFTRMSVVLLNMDITAIIILFK